MSDKDMLLQEALSCIEAIEEYFENCENTHEAYCEVQEILADYNNRRANLEI